MSWSLKRKLVDSMEYSEVSDPLQVSYRLAYIAEDTIGTYIHLFMCNTGNKIVISQLQNSKSNFPKFCKVYARQNQKTNLIHLHIHLVETITLILHSKVVFKRLFSLKLFIQYIKNTLHALNSLILRGNKRSHLLK